MAATSLDGSFQTTSKAGDVSLARQRRRRTTRRSGTRDLNQTEPQNGDTRSLSLSQSSDSLLTTPSAQPPTPSPVSSSLSSTTGTARQRRSQRKRETLRKTVTASREPQPVPTTQHELEDSTAGVASLLERNLDQTDGGEEVREQSQGPVAEGEVIANHSTESPNHHTSEEYQEPEDQNQPESGPPVNGETAPSN